MSQNNPSHDPTDFPHLWKQAFGNTPPLGHILRRDFRGQWTRFHALPKAKRYADTPQEAALILSRANALATDCFGESARIWVITGTFPGFGTEDNDLPLRFDMAKALTWIDREEAPEDQLEHTFFATEIDWQPSSFDRLLTQMANDGPRVIFFSADTQTVLAPYDGGFDIISLRPEKLNDLETKHRAWMSARSDKL